MHTGMNHSLNAVVTRYIECLSGLENVSIALSGSLHERRVSASACTVYSPMAVLGHTKRWHRCDHNRKMETLSTRLPFPSIRVPLSHGRSCEPHTCVAPLDKMLGGDNGDSYMKHGIRGTRVDRFSAVIEALSVRVAGQRSCNLRLHHIGTS
jgi:hypothetical protein